MVPLVLCNSCGFQITQNFQALFPCIFLQINILDTALAVHERVFLWKVKEQPQPRPEQQGRAQGRTIFPWILHNSHRTLEALLKFTTDLLPIKDPAEQQGPRQYYWSCLQGHRNPAALHNVMCCNSSLLGRNALCCSYFRLTQPASENLFNKPVSTLSIPRGPSRESHFSSHSCSNLAVFSHCKWFRML